MTDEDTITFASLLMQLGLKVYDEFRNGSHEDRADLRKLLGEELATKVAARVGREKALRELADPPGDPTGE